jgi:hypothetical protein
MASTPPMAIERGASWGTPGRLPADAPAADGDASLATFVGDGVTHARLDRGDLARTLGIRSTGDTASRSTTTQLLPIDVIDITLDERTEVVCVAHAVVGSLIGSGRVVAIMNAAFIDRLNLAPRAHPGDGLADVVTIELNLADRLKARRRMVTAGHVPHPDITIRRQNRGTVEFARPRSVRIDGNRLCRVTRIDFTVRSHAITVGV